jgi:hypothetical protein
MSSDERDLLSEPIAVTLKVAGALETLGVPYFIGGSLAGAIHGAIRASIDSDIIADLHLADAERLVQALGGEFYLDMDTIRDAIRRRGSFNLIHLRTMFKVDVFILKDRGFDRTELERRSCHVLANDPARKADIASAEDIIIAKLEWHRKGGGHSERQWLDVVGILKTQTGQLDLAYMRSWAGELGVEDLLDKALKEAE